jgi:hydrogenase expression/formation protein HypC
MCLGVPGKVLETWREHDLLMGKVEFGGLRQTVCLEPTPEVQPGQYVIVHVGVSLQVIDADEAQRVFATLREMESLDERVPSATRDGIASVGRASQEPDR